jgi:hypothetical protein
MRAHSIRRRGPGSAGLAILVGLAVLAASPRAFAQSASVQAQSLFDDGRRLIKAGKIAEACIAFESSQLLDPAITTLLNLAECREKNRQLATAWGAFVEAGRMARAGKNAKLARVAAKYARKLEPKLSKLTIAIPTERQVAGLEILRGDEPVKPAGWNHALPIDGGTYTITARAPGYTTWSTTKTIKPESDAQTVDVPRLVKAEPTPVAATKPGASKPAASKPGATTAPGTSDASRDRRDSVASTEPRRDRDGETLRSRPSPTGTTSTTGATAIAPSSSSSSPARSSPRPGAPSPSDQPSSRSLVLPIAFGAAALAFGGGALAFHLSGNSTYERAKAATDQEERDSLYNAANTRRYLAEGCAVAALGMAGVAVYITLRGGRESRSATAMAPVVSPQLTGLALVGRW